MIQEQLGQMKFFHRLFQGLKLISRRNNRDVNTIPPGAHLLHSSMKNKQTNKQTHKDKDKTNKK